MDVPALYSKGIMLHAVKASVSHLACLTLLIAALTMYFNNELSLAEKGKEIGSWFERW